MKTEMFKPDDTFSSTAWNGEGEVQNYLDANIIIIMLKRMS